MDTGRRALPPEGMPSPPPTPRRGPLPDPPRSHPHPGRARRAVATPPEDEGARLAWMSLAALGVAMTVLIGGLYLILGPRSTGTTSPAPSPSSSRVEASTSSTESSDGGSSPSTEPSPSLDESPPGPSPPAELDLGDVRLTVPDGWEVYADEVVQDDRRLVRLREPATDVRVQAVTLTTVGEDLTQACRDLVTDQQQAFTGVAESVVVDVPLTGGASGVSCAFTGTRTSDTVAAKVEFTIIRRDADAQSLVFRDTVPDSVAEGSPVLAQLADMECAATETFGVVVGTC